MVAFDFRLQRQVFAVLFSRPLGIPVTRQAETAKEPRGVTGGKAPSHG